MFAEIPFELNARCTKTPDATGPAVAGKGPFTKGIGGVARSCAGFALGEVAEGVGRDATSLGDKISPAETLALAKQRALDEVRARIAAALAELPHCLGISCPKETIVVKIGPLTSTVEPLPVPILNMIMSTIARVPWRIQLTYSK